MASRWAWAVRRRSRSRRSWNAVPSVVSRPSARPLRARTSIRVGIGMGSCGWDGIAWAAGVGPRYAASKRRSCVARAPPPGGAAGEGSGAGGAWVGAAGASAGGAGSPAAVVGGRTSQTGACPCERDLPVDVDP